ncbi:MAG TPA: AMP-binding protein [Solirubrobacteraceae bacterium]|nr:AMP-binding protein [Solirubrobacteraceae bacterium]
MSKTFTSRYAPVAIGGATFHELVAETAARHGDRIAFVDGPGGRELTYATLAERADRVAATLAAGGFKAGDVLALQAPNMAPWAGIALGAMSLGGAVTGIPTTATYQEVKRQMADSGAALLVREIGEELIVRSRSGPRPAVAPDAVALLPYSSGTSGLPKRVPISHANLVTAVRQLLRGIRLSPDDVVLALAPFSHVMGFVIALGSALATGARLVTVPRFEPDDFLPMLARHRVSVVIVPPPLMSLLARSPLDLPAVQLIVSGGAPLGAELQQAVAERFPHAAVGQGWGLTETTACGTMPDRELGTVPGSAGRVMPNTELRISECGELLLRGPQAVAGTALIDADGWVHTGDVGRVDADGNVFVVDRLKELIKVNALQVAPAELEALLGTHPAVAECAVIGRPDQRCGEVPIAFVVPRVGVDADALMAFVADRVAPHKRIREVRFVEAIPRTPAGKILRRRLRDEGAAAGQPSYV